MNSKKKNIRKTSGTRKKYKPGQLITVNNKLFRVMKKPSVGAHCCEGCYFHKRKLFNDACYRFCYFLPGNCKFVLNEKSVKHKGLVASTLSV